jgi:hypothetical protein
MPTSTLQPRAVAALEAAAGITEAEWAQLQLLTSRAAKAQTRHLPPGYVEADDIGAQLMLHLTQRPVHTRILLDRYSTEHLQAILHDEARIRVGQARDAYRRTHGDDEYSAIRVRDLLESGVLLDPAIWTDDTEPYIMDAERVDVNTAFDQLPTLHRTRLSAVWGPEAGPEAPQPSSEQIAAAIKRLTQVLNSGRDQARRDAATRLRS